MIDWSLPVCTLPECSDPAALEAKLKEEIAEWKQEPEGSMAKVMELWDIIQTCVTWAANDKLPIHATLVYISAQLAMNDYYYRGLPVAEARERVLVKNATRPRLGGGTGYYSPEVCAEIMAGKWGEK